MAELHPRIRATSDPELAARLGLTHWDAELGQYTAARAGEPQERPGEGVFFQALEEIEPEEIATGEEAHYAAPDDEGGEPSSDGMSSSISSPEIGTSTEPGKTSRRKRAPTTENPS